MRSLFLFILAPIVLMGCLSNSNNNSGSTSVRKITEVPLGYTGPIDLAKLQLKENAPALLNTNKIKLEAVSDTDMTMLGLDRIKSRAAEALQYGNVNLAGHEGKLSNYAVFHYEENSKRLIFFEVVLYTRDKAAALSKELEEMGKPVFEKKLPDGSLTLDEEGNAVPRKPDEKQRFRVWEAKPAGITYIYNVVENSRTFTAVLTVLKQTDKLSREWISMTGSDWYLKQ